MLCYTKVQVFYIDCISWLLCKKKKKKRHTERDNFLFYIVQSVYFYESYFFVWTLLIVYKYISNPLLFSFYSISDMNLKHQLNNADQIRKIMKIYL